MNNKNTHESVMKFYLVIWCNHTRYRIETDHVDNSARDVYFYNHTHTHALLSLCMQSTANVE